MDLEAIRLFSIVAQEGSLQGAARAGSASRTTIRRKLDELEEEVGVPLMSRGTHGIELTEAGDMLARRSAELVHQFELLLATAREIALNPPRPIRIMVPVGAPGRGHAMTLQLLRQIWPDLQLEIHSEVNAGTNGCGSYDLCFTLLEEVTQGPHEVIVLGHVTQMLFASPEYLDEHGPITSLDDLDDHKILWWDDPSDDGPARLPCSGQPDLEIEPAFITNDMQALHTMADVGVGIAYCPHSYFEDYDRERFIRVLPEVGRDRPMKLLVSDAVAESPRIVQLVSIVREFLNLNKL